MGSEYSGVEKKLLAIIWTAKYFKPFRFGRKFNIMEDHNPLKWYFSFKTRIQNNYVDAYNLMNSIIRSFTIKANSIPMQTLFQECKFMRKMNKESPQKWKNNELQHFLIMKSEKQIQISTNIFEIIFEKKQM